MSARRDPFQIVRAALAAKNCAPHGKPYNFHSKCPGCGDENPDALHVCEGADGRVVPWCDRCEGDAIVSALGLTMADLLPAEPRARPTEDTGEASDPADSAQQAQEDHHHGLGAMPKYPGDVLPPQARALLVGTLPDALVGGAALAALAAAIGEGASVEVTGSWHERAILWVANIAPRGAGKSPAQDIAFQPLRDHEAALGDDDPALLLDDQTLEAIARDLKASDGAAAMDVDELAQLLRGLGEYKGGASGDRGRLLKLWSGQPWSFRRVGGGKDTNAVTLRIAQPTLVICGGLQPALHPLLGGDEDGMRPRWLPHLAELPELSGERIEAPLSESWDRLLHDLLRLRDKARGWKLSSPARGTFEHRRYEWKIEARGAEASSVTAALLKADKHLARVALVLAEAGQPGKGGTIGPDVIERAAAIVQFTLDCWRALPDQGDGLGLSSRDRALNVGVHKLVAWLEERPRRKATRREIQRARVAGVRKPAELDALLADYEATYPRSRKEEPPPEGGKPMIVISAPERSRARERPAAPIGVDSVDTDIHSNGNSRSRAKSGGTSSGDTASGDTGFGDTAPNGDDPSIPCRDPAVCRFRNRHATGPWACAYNHPEPEVTR